MFLNSLRKNTFNSLKGDPYKKGKHEGGAYTMNRKRSLMKYSWMLASVVVMISGQALGQEPLALIPRLEILTPGMTRNIPITQETPFPQGVSQFAILLIGSGPLSITLSKVDIDGDLLVLSGVGISSAGLFPFFKWGYTAVTFNVGINIGDDRFPYGMLLLSCWVDEPEEPNNTYYLTIRF